MKLGARIATVVMLTMSTLVVADSVGPPLGPIDRTLVKEEPCDPKAAVGDQGARALIDRYMCQVGLDGSWFQPYPCEIIKSTSKTVYLRFAKWNIPCEIVGTVTNKGLGFEGSMTCHPVAADALGDDALVDGKLEAIPGGFRIEQPIEKHTGFAIGHDDAIPRRTRDVVTSPKLAFNVCRRSWPKAFVSDNERAAAMQRTR